MSCPFKHLWGARPDDVSPSQSKPAPSHQQGSNGDASCPGKQHDGDGRASAPPAAPASQAAPPSKGRCPFGHGSTSGSAAATTAASSAAGAGPAQGGVCPFGHGGGGSGSGGSAAAAAAASHDKPASAEEPASEEEPEPAVCPYGFGGGKGQRMSQFHCVLCRSLFYDCVVTSCSHRFCAGCISRFADCPLCGADISGATSDPDTQALVEQFIEAHGVGPGVLQELEGTAPPSERTAQPAEEHRGRAAFLLQLGLRAMAAGNLPSARHRLTQCRERLLQDLQAQQAQQAQRAAGNAASSALSKVHLGEAAAAAEQQQQGQAAAAAAEATAAGAALDAAKSAGQQDGEQQQQEEELERESGLRSQLGAVCGCLGDTARGSGDWEGAAGYYEESVGQLRLAGGSGEAQHALSVTLNKLGELHHMRGDLEAALPLYQQSLAIRRQRLAALALQRQGQAGAAAAAREAAAGEAQQAQQLGQQAQQAEWCAAAVDVAVGCLKVADALQGLGRSGGAGEASAALQEAASLVASVEDAAGGNQNTQQSQQAQPVPQLPAPLLAKLAAVKAHLARQSQAPP